jgi:glycosyltransferase involved in cell wall biosynthesis
MQNKLISVCIPSYNQTYYLKKTIDSVYMQKGVNFEIIVSDDSLNQDVHELVKEYDSITPKIRYYKNNPSLGSPENWNYAISQARGEYIKILHHDEYFISDIALKTMLDVISLNHECLVFSASKSINNGIETDFSAKSYIVENVNLEPEKLILGNVIGGPSSVIFHRSKKTKFDTKLVWLVDIDFYISVLKNNTRLVYIDRILRTSVIANHNLTNQCLKDTELLIFEYTYLFRKHLKKLSFAKQIV